MHNTTAICGHRAFLAKTTRLAPAPAAPQRRCCSCCCCVCGVLTLSVMSRGDASGFVERFCEGESLCCLLCCLCVSVCVPADYSWAKSEMTHICGTPT